MKRFLRFITANSAYLIPRGARTQKFVMLYKQNKHTRTKMAQTSKLHSKSQIFGFQYLPCDHGNARIRIWKSYKIWLWSVNDRLFRQPHSMNPTSNLSAVNTAAQKRSTSSSVEVLKVLAFVRSTVLDQQIKRIRAKICCFFVWQFTALTFWWISLIDLLIQQNVSS